MPLWFPVILAVCAVVLTGAAVPLLVALTRSVRRLDGVLVIVERELTPLVAELHGVADALRDLVRETQQELKRLGAIEDRIDDVLRGLNGMVTGLAGLTRAGQLVGFATAIRKGVDVFVQRYRRQEGDRHGE